MKKHLFALFCIFLLGSCSIVNRDSVRIDIQKDKYKVVAKYPKLQSPDNQRLLKKFVLKQITKFQASYGTDDVEYKHKLKINYKIYNSKILKSIVFKVRVFEENEVENLFFKTFVFNKDTEKQVLISDILDSEPKLMLTSKILGDQLKELLEPKYYDKNRVLRAISPKASNFKNFYYKKDKLHIIFSPFELADLEAGYFDLIVDFPALKE